MTLSPASSSAPRTPRLYASSLPESEQDSADLIQFLLMSMDSYHQDFVAAVELYRHLASVIPPLSISRWPSIPVRDGAMSLFHFWKSMAGIRKELPLCPTLSALVDTELLGEAGQHFGNAFPQVELLRRAVSHSAEELAGILRDTQNTDSGVVIISSVAGNTFQTTKDGQRLGYEISDKTAQTLGQIKETFFSGFRDVERVLRTAPKA